MYYEYREVIVNNLSGLGQLNQEQEVHGEETLKDPEFEGIRKLLLSQYLSMRTTFKKVPQLLKQSSEDVQMIIYALIDKYQLFEYGPFIRAIAGVDKANAQAFQLGTSHTSGAEAMNNAPLRTEYSKAKTKENKLIALNKISHTKITEVHLKEIEAFLKDKNPGIVQGALILIPLPLSLKFGEMLIQAMESMPLSHLAIPLFKEKDVRLEKLVIKKLQQIESSQWSDMNSQLLSLQLIKILKKIGGVESQNYLVKTLQFNNSEIKYFATYALSALKFKADKEQESYFTQMIEKEVAFCVWLLACKSDLSVKYKKMRVLLKSLETEFKQTQEKIFIYLSFIYPEETILKIRENLVSTSTEKNVFGIEMCEMILTPALRSILIPLFMNSSNAEKLKLLSKDFPQQNLSLLKRLANICYYDFTKANTWIKILATNLISKMDKSIPRELIANTYINNPTIKESSYLAIKRINSETFENMIQRESYEYRQHFDKLTRKDLISGKIDSMFKRINKLKSFPLFSNIYEGILMKMAFHLIKIKLSENKTLSERYGYDAYIHLIYKGTLTLHATENNEKVVFQKGNISGLFEPYNLRDVDFSVNGETELLIIEASVFFQLVSIYDELKDTLYNEADALEPTNDPYFYTS
jgi:hypothetical protein